MKKNKNISVIYLARCADGIDTFTRFVISYKKYYAGIEHDLVVIYKGFESEDCLNRAKLIFSSIKHSVIMQEDIGFDIGSYIDSSKVIESEYLCFMNTHSEISANNWLKLMIKAATQSDVGITGAMGSYESLNQSWKLIQKFYWLFYMREYPCPENIYKYYNKFLDYLPQRNLKILIKSGFQNSIKNYFYQFKISNEIKNNYKQFETHWENLLLPGKMFEDLSTIKKFPNNHIRTNCFLVKNIIFKKFKNTKITNKSDACLFESGPNSITNLVKDLGYKAVIVGKNGNIYEEDDWWNSGTFRQSDQSNLLINDNHTRAYSAMNNYNKFLHSYLSWGHKGVLIPFDFNDLGVSFTYDF